MSDHELPEHEGGWDSISHYGFCGQSCPCCGSHNEEDIGFGLCSVCDARTGRDHIDEDELPVNILDGVPWADVEECEWDVDPGGTTGQAHGSSEAVSIAEPGFTDVQVDSPDTHATMAAVEAPAAATATEGPKEMQIESDAIAAQPTRQHLSALEATVDDDDNEYLGGSEEDRGDDRQDCPDDHCKVLCPTAAGVAPGTAQTQTANHTPAQTPSTERAATSKESSAIDGLADTECNHRLGVRSRLGAAAASCLHTLQHVPIDKACIFIALVSLLATVLSQPLLIPVFAASCAASPIIAWAHASTWLLELWLPLLGLVAVVQGHSLLTHWSPASSMDKRKKGKAWWLIFMLLTQRVAELAPQWQRSGAGSSQDFTDVHVAGPPLLPRGTRASNVARPQDFARAHAMASGQVLARAATHASRSHVGIAANASSAWSPQQVREALAMCAAVVGDTLVLMSAQQSLEATTPVYPHPMSGLYIWSWTPDMQHAPAAFQHWGPAEYDKFVVFMAALTWADHSSGSWKCDEAVLEDVETLALHVMWYGTCDVTAMHDHYPDVFLSPPGSHAALAGHGPPTPSNTTEHLEAHIAVHGCVRPPFRTSRSHNQRRRRAPTPVAAGLLSNDCRRRARRHNGPTIPALVRCVHQTSTRTQGGQVAAFGHSDPEVILVGTAEDVSCGYAYFEFSLNNSTGRIPVRHYLFNENSQPASITTGVYIMVLGEVRPGSPFTFVSRHLRLVESPDEISYHAVAAVHAQLRMPPPMLGGMVPARRQVPPNFTWGCPVTFSERFGDARECAQWVDDIFQCDDGALRVRIASLLPPSCIDTASAARDILTWELACCLAACAANVFERLSAMSDASWVVSAQDCATRLANNAPRAFVWSHGGSAPASEFVGSVFGADAADLVHLLRQSDNFKFPECTASVSEQWSEACIEAALARQIVSMHKPRAEHSTGWVERPSCDDDVGVVAWARASFWDHMWQLPAGEQAWVSGVFHMCEAELRERIAASACLQRGPTEAHLVPALLSWHATCYLLACASSVVDWISGRSGSAADLMGDAAGQRLAECAPLSHLQLGGRSVPAAEVARSALGARAGDLVPLLQASPNFRAPRGSNPQLCSAVSLADDWFEACVATALARCCFVTCWTAASPASAQPEPSTQDLDEEHALRSDPLARLPATPDGGDSRDIEAEMEYILELSEVDRVSDAQPALQHKS